MKIYNLEANESGNIDLPSQFNEELRLDLIKRAVIVHQLSERQPYGSHPEAGKRHSAKLSRRRRKYRGSYGFGISRVPRKILSKSGTRFGWQGAVAPGTVGGRRAHPPKAEKMLEKKLNKKEKAKAVRSAISATADFSLVKKRGHKIPENYPFILSSDIEKLEKTRQVKELLKKLNFTDELKRAQERKVRAGKGKARSRKYKAKASILLVVSNDCKLLKSADNIPGIDIVKINSLNAELLAPGTLPGRAALFTEAAIQRMEKEQLFM